MGHSSPPSFQPMSIVATVAHLSYCWALVENIQIFMLLNCNCAKLANFEDFKICLEGCVFVDTLYNYYYYYICLTVFFQDYLGKLAPERQTILDFAGARDDGVAMASAGPYPNQLHFSPDRWPCQYLTTQFLQARCHCCHPNNSIIALKADK